LPTQVVFRFLSPFAKSDMRQNAQKIKARFLEKTRNLVQFLQKGNPKLPFYSKYLKKTPSCVKI
jgi:hypothetical protein